VASDIYISDGIRNMRDIDFVECSITDTPFDEAQFDIVFSNHVVEHIGDIDSAFEELRRIGKPDCIYAFSVPTNIWLLLSIPAEYYDKARSLVRKISSILCSKKVRRSQNSNARRCDETRATRFVRKLGFSGHGVHSGFLDCYRSFTIKNWRQLFSQNGFSILKTEPLLLYGASQFPVIPTLRVNLLNRLNICSSVLFVMEKKDRLVAQEHLWRE
jgi:SAM-dependent methyltransferase